MPYLMLNYFVLIIGETRGRWVGVISPFNFPFSHFMIDLDLILLLLVVYILWRSCICVKWIQSDYFANVINKSRPIWCDLRKISNSCSVLLPTVPHRPSHAAVGVHPDYAAFIQMLLFLSTYMSKNVLLALLLNGISPKYLTINLHTGDL